MIDDWHYYNHALVPSCAPHEEPDVSQLDNELIWNSKGGKAMFARWTSDFDCGYETEWWYCIKDEPFDIQSVKSDRRYEIKKGLKNFETKVINPVKHAEELYNIQIEAYKAYPSKYRPKVEHDSFVTHMKIWESCIVLGAISCSNNILAGYSLFTKNGRHITFCSQKVIPAFEKLQINAALVYTALEYFREDLSAGSYIVDGERNIVHETRFQDYLEKYFLFRKAYCKLNIRYKKPYDTVVNILYPFRAFTTKHDSFGPFHNINGILSMEKIIRNQCASATFGRETSFFRQ